MIETTTLLPGITLRCRKDTRFKQGCLSIQLLRQMDSREAAMNALLSNVLLRGTKKCPDIRAITQRLDELYGAAVSSLVRRVGDYQAVGLYCGFLDDRFALAGDKVFAPMAEFVGELLLDSPVENGGFLPEFVESEKKNLIATIESERNDKRAYAMGRLLKTMCREDTFGIPRLGEIEEVAAITPQALYEHYREILRTSPIDIFYVGSADSDAVAAALIPMLCRLDRAPVTLPPQTGFHPCEGRDTVETMEIAQGKLCMGFTTPITGADPRFAALQVLNVIYGSGMTSKLFMTVREKMSLCYSIGSGLYLTKGILTVSAGIDFDKEQLTKDEILRQLEACKAGHITPEELTAAKQALFSGLRSTYDSPGAIESYFSTAALTGNGLDPEKHMAAVEAVTREDVAAAANTLTLHSTYFLKGERQ